MMADKDIKISFMTTIGVNVGDEFIREGICSFLDEILTEWQPFYVNKHNITTLHTHVYDEPCLLSDKFRDADVIIQAGAPVYWKIGDSASYNVEWAEELWRKRIFRLGSEKPILNIAAGACQPFPDTPKTFLADPLCVDFANKAAKACSWTSVRDPLAAQILLALGHDHYALPCSAFHAARRYKTHLEPENVIGINLMPLGGHFRLREDFNEVSWRAVIDNFLAEVRRHHRILFIAHDDLEKNFMASLCQGGEKVFFSSDYRQYLPVYGRCQAVVANRVHGAVCAAGFGIPGVIVGNDTRLQIADFIGLPSRYVADVTAEELLDLLDDAVTSRNVEHDRLLALREETAAIYRTAMAEVLSPLTLGKSPQQATGVLPLKQGERLLCNSVQQTLQGFSRRLTLPQPTTETSMALASLLTAPGVVELVRSGAEVLVVAVVELQLAWLLASLGARVTLAMPESCWIEAIDRQSKVAAQHGLKLSRVHISDGKILLPDSAFGLAVVTADLPAATSEALRVLRPTGMLISSGGTMPAQAIDMPWYSGKGVEFAIKPLSLRPQARILLPRFDTFGDIVIFESLLESLRHHLPEAELCVLVRKGYDDLSELFPTALKLRWVAVDQQAYVVPNEGHRRDFGQVLHDLASEVWDVVLLTSFNRTWLDEQLLAALPDVKKIVLGSAVDAVTCSEANLTIVAVDQWSHDHEKYRLLLQRMFGETAVIARPRLEIPTGLAELANDKLLSLQLADVQFVVCLPAGTQNQKFKVWPLERYAELLCWLAETRGLVPLLVGHISEADAVTSLAGMLSARNLSARTWLGIDGEVPMLAALLQRAALFIGNDSGPMHIAAALGLPTVAIFGGGTYPRFLPVSNCSCSVVAELPCFKCYWNCIFGDAPCIRFVEVADVQAAVDRVLGPGPVTDNLLNGAARISWTVHDMIARARDNAMKYSQELAERLAGEQLVTAELQAGRSRTDALLGSLSCRLTTSIRMICDGIRKCLK